MKIRLPASMTTFVAEFAKFYHASRIEAENLRAIRYRIVTTLKEYQTSKKIRLALTDCPGDLLPPMSIEQIKKAPDIIPHMHPIDVNSINDLYYLSKDKITEVKICGEKIIAVTDQGLINEYDINDQIDLNTIPSRRVAYTIGHMQAEKLFRTAYKEDLRYSIVKDNITTLHVSEHKTKKEFLKKPIDILFSGEYKLYSKEDIVKIGYICGQMASAN
jgi:hypothetical protein